MLALLGLISVITYSGHGVLVSGERPIAAYMQTRPAASGTTHLDIWEVANGRTVLAYDQNMTKLLHTVVVSDDLREFRHIHPTLRTDSAARSSDSTSQPVRATHRARRTRAARTHAPAHISSRSTRPACRPARSLRFASRSGRTASPRPISIPISARWRTASSSASTIAMATANDCGDAMMAAAPPLAPNASVPSRFVMQVLAPRAQRYDFWIQFTGGHTLYTVPLLITAR